MSIRDLQWQMPHLNLVWTMEQMDRFEHRARQGASADDLAFEFDTTTLEIEKVAERNHIHVRRRFGVAL